MVVCMLSTLFLKLIDEEKFITIIHVAVSSQRGDHGCELLFIFYFIHNYICTDNYHFSSGIKNLPRFVLYFFPTFMSTCIKIVDHGQTV